MVGEGVEVVGEEVADFLLLGELAGTEALAVLDLHVGALADEHLQTALLAGHGRDVHRRVALQVQLIEQNQVDVARVRLLDRPHVLEDPVAVLLDHRLELLRVHRHVVHVHREDPVVLDLELEVVDVEVLELLQVLLEPPLRLVQKAQQNLVEHYGSSSGGNIKYKIRDRIRCSIILSIKSGIESDSQ